MIQSKTSVENISLHLTSSHLGIMCTIACISATIYGLLLECLTAMFRKIQRARKVKSMSTFISVQQRSLSTHTNVQRVKWIHCVCCVHRARHANRGDRSNQPDPAPPGQIYCCKMPIFPVLEISTIRCSGFEALISRAPCCSGSEPPRHPTISLFLNYSASDFAFPMPSGT